MEAYSIVAITGLNLTEGCILAFQYDKEIPLDDLQVIRWYFYCKNIKSMLVKYLIGA